MKAIGYVRVSSQIQASEGVSIAAQKEKIRQYAGLHDLELIGIEEDLGISGKKQTNRPGIQKALDKACQSKGVLIVYSLSRLSRSVIDCCQISERINKCGASLASISEKIDTSSANGRFFFHLMASLSTMEREIVGERTKLALGYLRKQGFKTGGTVPYGYQIGKKGLLEPLKSEQEGITVMREGRKDGLTYRGICSLLERKGFKTKQGGQWQANSVKKILTKA